MFDTLPADGNKDNEQESPLKQRKSRPRSLAPVGQTTPAFRHKLNTAGIHDPELIMAGLWADLNRAGLDNFGILPVQMIAHQCTKDCKGEAHSYTKLAPEDVEIISATMQWLASPAGRGFYETFLKELGTKVEYDHDEAIKQRAERERKFSSQ